MRTPEVVLTHHHRASRGSDAWLGDVGRFRQRRVSLLRSRWMSTNADNEAE